MSYMRHYKSFSENYVPMYGLFSRAANDGAHTVYIFIIKPNLVLVTLSFLFLASSSDTIQSMRYANSLESLDAVSTSIQQGTIHILRKHFLGFFVPPPPLHKCIFFLKVTNLSRFCNYIAHVIYEWSP